jgi:hypothetical protein
VTDNAQVVDSAECTESLARSCSTN